MEEYKDLIDTVEYKLWNFLVGRRLVVDITEKDKHTVIIPSGVRINKHLTKRLALNFDSFTMPDCQMKETLEELLKPFKERLKEINVNQEYIENMKDYEINLSIRQELEEKIEACQGNLEDAIKRKREAEDDEEYWREELQDSKNALEELDVN